jgi:hypothetical protein
MSEEDDQARALAVLHRRLADDGRPYLWVIDDLPPVIDSATFRSLLAPTRRPGPWSLPGTTMRTSAVPSCR